MRKGTNLHGETWSGLFMGKQAWRLKEEACRGDPFVNLYYTKFQSRDSCMHHCENLDTRVPSVTSSQDWATLQRSLKNLQ